MSPLQAPQSFRQLIDGVELQWSERGSGSNVVVLHGLSDSERSWWPVMAELGKHYRVFGLDLAGCGLSARPDASYSLDWQTRLVAAWLDHVGIGSCDLVGHSYGGGVALGLMLYRASILRRMALVAPGGLGREVALELRLASLPFVTEHCGQPWMGLVTRLLLCLNGGGLPEQEREQLFKFNKAPGTARAFARMTRDVIRLRGQTRHFLERAAELGSLPAMALFWGDKDRIIPIRHGEALTRALDHCELRRFPGAGHFLHWDHPGELSAALIGYLSTPQIAPARLLAVAGSGVTAAALPGRAALSGPKNETPTE